MLNAENLLIIHEKPERIRLTHTIISLQKKKNSFVIEIANETYPNRKFCGVHFFFNPKRVHKKTPLRMKHYPTIRPMVPPNTSTHFYKQIFFAKERDRYTLYPYLNWKGRKGWA